MKGDFQSHFRIYPEDYTSAIDEERDVYLQFYYLNSNAEIALLKIIHLYLVRYDALYLKEMLTTVVKELVNNAVKANIKRAYFNDHNLNINNTDDYVRGMRTFKSEAFEKEKISFEELVRHKLVVRVSFVSKNNRLAVHVINNSPMLPQEQEKVQTKIDKAYAFPDISEAFDEVLDDTEGAGLGLIMAVMLFKNAGFPKDLFRITKKENLTIATVILQLSLEKRETAVPIAEELASELDTIPAFPSNIKEIQILCANPDSKIKDIAEKIKRDPGLTTNILKIANSAGYMTINRVSSIEEAVMKIGMKGINALLVASGVQKVLESRYKKFETIWKDSYKTAFYCQRLAVKFKKQNLLEFAYLAALLSSIGKLVILSIKPEIYEKIKNFVGYKEISDAGIIEEIGLGISHSTLGAMILRKWKFNEALVISIEYHTRPHMVPNQYRELTYLVYLSNALIDVEHSRIRYELVDESVLQYFDIADKEEMISLHEMLKRAYEVQLQEIK